MKKYFLVLSLIFSISFATTKLMAANEDKGAEMTFEKTSYNFGKIAKGTKNLNIKFKYTNTGTQPLFITRIASSCGCTKPIYSQEPIMPGATAEIEVGYSATDVVGVFNRKLTVFSNADNDTVILTIKGEIIN